MQRAKVKGYFFYVMCYIVRAAPKRLLLEETPLSRDLPQREGFVASPDAPL